MVEPDIDGIIKILEVRNEEKRNNSAFGGSMDGYREAAIIDTQIEYYLYGRAGDIPPNWKSATLQWQRENDPEYAIYLELKKKFEG